MLACSMRLAWAPTAQRLLHLHPSLCNHVQSEQHLLLRVELSAAVLVRLLVFALTMHQQGFASSSLGQCTFSCPAVRTACFPFGR